MNTARNAAASRWAWLDGDWPWRFIIVSLLLLGIGLRLVEVTYDRFDVDEYHLMVGIDQGLGDYVRMLQGTDAPQYSVHYWLMHRLIGNNLLGYRFLTLLCGIALLAATAYFLRRFWPAEKLLPPIALAILAVGADAVFLSRYGMFAYASTYLQAAALFFLFLRLAEGPLPRRAWRWITVILPVAAFFTNEFLMAPLVVGVTLTVLYRWLAAGPGRRSFRTVLGWLWEMAPLLIYPLVYVLRQYIAPYTFWGAGRRVDQTNLYFYSAGYPATISGIGAYLLTNTYELFSTLLAPGSLSDKPAVEALVLAGCGLLALVAFVQIVRGRAGRRATYAGLFLLISVGGTALGSLVGTNPYGIARYAPFLTLPSVTLIGLGGSYLYRWISGRLGSARFCGAIVSLASVVLLAGGAILCTVRLRVVESVHQGDRGTIAWMLAEQPDLILTDRTIGYMLYGREQQIYDRVEQMGVGAYYARGIEEVPAATRDIIAGAPGARPVDTIVVAVFPHGLGRTDTSTTFGERFPAWNALIEKEFTLVEERAGLHIAARVYRRQ
jgi:hypothetical protein